MYHITRNVSFQMTPSCSQKFEPLYLLHRMEPPFVKRKLVSRETGKLLTFVAQSERNIVVQSHKPYINCHLCHMCTVLYRYNAFQKFLVSYWSTVVQQRSFRFLYKRRILYILAEKWVHMKPDKVLARLGENKTPVELGCGNMR